jgi:hypothetical protein
MGEIEDRAGAFVEHVGIEALGAKQGDVTLEPQSDRLQPLKLAFKHLFATVEIGARVKAMIAGLEMIGEIARSTAGQERKDESREPHPAESAREPLSGRYRPRFSTARPT